MAILYKDNIKYSVELVHPVVTIEAVRLKLNGPHKLAVSAGLTINDTFFETPEGIAEVVEMAYQLDFELSLKDADLTNYVLDHGHITNASGYAVGAFTANDFDTRVLEKFLYDSKYFKTILDKASLTIKLLDD